MLRFFRRIAQAVVVCAVAAAGVALGGAPASAHVTVTPSVTTANSYTVLLFSVPHGCDESPTTKVSVQIPADIPAVTPTINPGWTIEKVMADLNPPIKDSHGNELTKRVAEVIYTAKTPLAADMRDTFELSLKLPDSAGKTLVFPAVQTCQQGETAWTQVPSGNQKADDLEHPAPMFTLTKAADTEGTDTQANTTTDQVAAGNSSDGGSDGLTWAALVIATLGLLVGGFALLRPMLRRSTPSA